MPKHSGSIGASTSQTTSDGDVFLDLTPKAERHNIATEFTPKKTEGLGDEILATIMRDASLRLCRYHTRIFPCEPNSQGILERGRAVNHAQEMIPIRATSLDLQSEI
jgi:hypothetical protein